MADFDPDAYLAGSSSEPSGSSFDPDAYLANFDPDKYLAGDGNADTTDGQRPTAEGPAGTALRAGASAVVPGAGALVGMGAGAAIGAPLGPVGGIVGGVVGGVLGGMGANVVQNKAKDALDIDDSAQRQANEEANPKSAFAGELAGSMLGMSPTAVGETIAQKVIQRGAGAAMMGGFQAGQDYLNDGTVDPTKAAMAAAAGAILPGVNKVGAKLVGAGERLVPGRPNRTSNPNADQTHVDVDDPSQETAVGDSVLAESPPTRDGSTTGNPQSAPARSDRVYPKEDVSKPPEGDMLTQGDMDPATSAALEEANPVVPAPAEAPAQPQAAAPSPEVKPPVQQQAPQMEPTVETGMPKPGEPVAVGENEATPMPPARAMPELKGETAANDTISDPQKAAGNYKKARAYDFGKPLKVETHEGDIRRSPADHPEPWENVSPADYGYFNKTMGNDKDHVDFYRPKEGSPDAGDKHFIVDQKDAATGKFDEHKVMTYYKDLESARDAYLRGFSDDKANARLHDITEVDRKALSKWLAKPGRKTQPFGDAMPKAPKPAAERAVVQDLVSKLKAQGKDAEAAKVLETPDAQLLAAVAGKRTRNYGVGTGSSAGYPVDGLLSSEGKPITANTKLKAQERSAKHKEVSNWFEESVPKKADESNGELLDRIKPAPGRGDLGGWAPTFKPREWLWAREASALLKKPTPKAIAKFRDAERLLRGGDEAVENYRGGNRVDADVAMNKRGGDENIANAEAKLQAPGKNAVEDAMIDAIDAKKKAKFDVPHEEAESMVAPKPVKTKADLKQPPHKTIDAGDSELAKIDTKAISKDALAAAAKRKAEVDALVGKKSAKANVASEDIKSGERKKTSIDVSDPETVKRLIELSNKAAKKKSLSDEELAQSDLTKMAAGKPKSNETAKLFDSLRDFGGNEEASLNVGKIKADMKRLKDSLTKTTPVASYIARPGTEPHSAYTRSLSDELHALDNKSTLHEENILDDHLAKLPKEADADALARIYKAREHDSAQKDMPANGKTHIESLAPGDKKIWDDHIKPLMDEANDFRETIRLIDPELAGPDVDHYIARITKGKTSEFDMLRKNDDPMGRRGVATSASMTNERPFVALENVATGDRHVIQNRDNGFTLWRNNKATRIKDPGYAFEANSPYSITNNKTGTKTDYIMRHATTDEIMNSGARFDLGQGRGTMPAKYYQNAGLSAALAHAKLGTMARNIIELARLSSTPEFKDLTTRSAAYAKERGWEVSDHPNFKGTYMAPELKEVMDDYAGKAPWKQNLSDLNQAVTKLLFWMPTAHIANVGAHWFVGRGFDNLNIKRGFETSMKAMQSVMKQDHIQKEMMENGAGLIYPSVRTRKFIEQVAHAVGEKMSEDPKKGWAGAAQAAGVPLKAVQDYVYNNSSKLMWAANDMFLTQRYLELKQKGLSPKEAISKAERDIPNYRLPTRVGSSGAWGRTMSNILQDGTALSFARYHAGMMNAYSDISRSTFGTKASIGDRVEGLGKLLALGALAMAYPMADKLAQYVTGNDAATQQRRGPMSIPYHLGRAAEGKEDIMSAARTTATITPLISTMWEALNNKDFRGKSIVEPDAVKKAVHGDVKSAGRVGVQLGEHAARGLISPLNTLETASKKAPPGSSQAMVPVRAIRDQALDEKNPSAAATKYEKMSDIKNFQAANTRFKKGGAGIIEGAYDRAVGK